MTPYDYSCLEPDMRNLLHELAYEQWIEAYEAERKRSLCALCAGTGIIGVNPTVYNPQPCPNGCAQPTPDGSGILPLGGNSTEEDTANSGNNVPQTPHP